MTKITIGIPCYNAERFIDESIISALSQTKKPHEIIVVNDGSTDGSLEKIKQHKGITVIDQTNRGLPSARNTMIMAMTGDYLLPLDADDILEDHAVERLTEVIEATGADIVAPSFKCFGLNTSDVILMPNPTLDDFRTANRIAYCAAIKRSALIDVGGYSPRMFWGYEDFHLWITMLNRGKKLVTIPDKLFLYRTQENSMISESIKHHDELIAQIMKDNPNVYA